MTNENIIGLAKQAGFLIDEAPIAQPYVIQATHYKIDDELQRFYELVRNEVLEEAAEACERLPLKSAKACAEVIRLDKS